MNERNARTKPYIGAACCLKIKTTSKLLMTSKIKKPKMKMTQKRKITSKIKKSNKIDGDPKNKDTTKNEQV